MVASATLSWMRLIRANQRALEHPVLLVGEGKSDASFLMDLFEQRGTGGLHFGFRPRALAASESAASVDR
jgi:hypothetical protein